MNFINKKFNSFINPLFNKLPAEKKSFENFVKYLIELNQKINSNETEEHNKNLLRDFLNSTMNLNYGQNYNINTNEQIDLAIHTGNSSDSPIAVIIEVKKPDNTNEMVTANNFYKKSFFELMLYYLREKIIKNNHSVKYLIITNLIDWYIFNSHDFERLFARNNKLVNDFKTWHRGGFDSARTNLFYNEIAAEFLKNSNDDIDFVHFSLKDFSLNEFQQIDISQIDLPDIQRDKLIELYKLLSPVTLLGVPFANDSNSLNKDFYDELLYILGLEEQTENGKKVINRLPPSKRIRGTVIENTIEMIYSESEEEIDDYIIQNNLTDTNKEEAIFSIALELVITWLNRILFLKLLEGQLIGYHNGDINYKFLTKENIKDYDELNELFFDVLAVPIDERNDDIKTKFANIPYLNSSLFDKTEFEKKILKINQLKDRYTIPIYPNTVLKDDNGKNIAGKKNTLEYLFDFLDAYDFSNISKEKIREKNKTLINASVLGLIFEKINGYKDGSFFTPGFISMFIAKETIRQVVLQKFNEKYNWNCNDFDDISNFIFSNKNKVNVKEYNSLVNSISICDPAVGSGHFLVSCLNELIACKSDLGILADENGKILPINVHIENDELILTDQEGNLFEYIPKNLLSAYIQKSIFYEKVNLIENCIFGVDINTKSTQITRLRLWIELLKNTFYNENNLLETLPNIDINIKDGNSLVSYSSLGANSLTYRDKETIKNYKEHVRLYKNTTNKDKKKELLVKIENDKNNIKGFIISTSELEFKLTSFKAEFHQKFVVPEQLLTEMNSQQRKSQENQRKNLLEKINKIEEEIKHIKELKFDKTAFEWEFEFPEILDDFGNFLGFDLVMGNPPYIQLQKDGGKLAKMFDKMNYQTFSKTGDIYTLFYERGITLLRQNGILAFITSNKWMRAGYGEKLRDFFLKYNPLILIDLGPGVFEKATVDTNILLISKSNNSNNLRAVTIKDNLKSNINFYKILEQEGVILKNLNKDAWTISNDIEMRIKEKIERIGTPLKDWDINIYYGIKTGFNEAFIIDGKKKDELIAQDPKSAEIIKPILRGRDIKRYKAEFADLWLINSHNGIKEKNIPRIDIVNNYPAIYNHLKKYENKLIERQDKGDHWTNLRNCAYLEEFEKEKIVWNRIASEKVFSFVPENKLIQDSMHFIVGNNLKYLCGILNSKLIKWLMNLVIGKAVGGNAGNSDNVKGLFIPKFSQITLEEQQPFIDLVEIILDKKENASTGSAPDADTTAEEREIDMLVYKLYDLTDEEIKIIEEK